MSAAGATGWLGEQTLPVLHLADFALPSDDGGDIRRRDAACLRRNWVDDDVDLSLASAVDGGARDA